MFLASAGIGTYDSIIIASVVLIISFFFSEISKKTSIPSVLMLIVFGIIAGLIVEQFGVEKKQLLPALKLLGTVGLIMIVLEAALELKLTKDKVKPILKALGIALVGLLLSTWLTAEMFMYFLPDFRGQTMLAWLYATPLSILSSAIIIPSVVDLRNDKKEFHIYESTFSDILGIMLFLFLESQLGHGEGGVEGGGSLNFLFKVLLTIALSFIFSYIIVFIFQKIKNSVKLFLLISVLLLLYAIGKKSGLSPLILILVFGLMIANIKLFFQGYLKDFLNKDAAHDIYHGLHVITMETAFVIRTFFFVIFGITIALKSLGDIRVAGISLILIAIIYVIRVILLRLSLGSDIIPQLFIAPRGLITVLLFFKIPEMLKVESFSEGYLLYVIIGTSLIMTVAMIWDKNRSNKAIKNTESIPVNEVKWKLPEG